MSAALSVHKPTLQTVSGARQCPARRESGSSGLAYLEKEEMDEEKSKGRSAGKGDAMVQQYRITVVYFCLWSCNNLRSKIALNQMLLFYFIYIFLPYQII